MEPESSSSSNSSGGGLTNKLLRDLTRQSLHLTVGVMLASEKSRMKASKSPIILGSLWFDPRTSTLWQVVRVAGSPTEVERANATLIAYKASGGILKLTTRRLPIPQLVQTFSFFGSVHDTGWRLQA